MLRHTDHQDTFAILPPGAHGPSAGYQCGIEARLSHYAAYHIFLSTPQGCHDQIIRVHAENGKERAG
jgi:hypothetical protein